MDYIDPTAVRPARRGVDGAGMSLQRFPAIITGGLARLNRSAGVAAVPLLLDTFTAPNNTQINLRSPDIGNDWVAVDRPERGLIVDNVATQSTGPTGQTVFLSQTNNSDVVVNFDARYISRVGDSIISCFLRQDGIVDSGWEFALYATSTTTGSGLRIFRRVNGAATQVVNVAAPLVANTWYNLTASAIGNTLSISNGTETATYVSSEFSTNTYHGMRFQRGSGQGVNIDNFQVDKA